LSQPGQSATFPPSLFLSLRGRWPALRDATDRLLPPAYRLGDVKSTVTATIITEVRVSVITGADNIQVIRSRSRSETAGTGPIAISSPVYDQAFHQFPGKLHVGIKMVAGTFGIPLQSLI
jgi:hypothetical protein